MPEDRERKYGTPPKIDLKNPTARGIEPLLEGLQQGTAQRLDDYLAFTARFHRFSVSHQLLVYMQRPDTTWVADYVKWQDMTCPVARGEKGIYILAPRTYKCIYKNTEEEEQAL
jgi:hypothetical protein